MTPRFLPQACRAAPASILIKNKNATRQVSLNLEPLSATNSSRSVYLTWHNASHWALYKPINPWTLLTSLTYLYPHPSQHTLMGCSVNTLVLRLVCSCVVRVFIYTPAVLCCPRSSVYTPTVCCYVQNKVTRQCLFTLHLGNLRDSFTV